MGEGHRDGGDGDQAGERGACVGVDCDERDTDCCGTLQIDCETGY